MNPIERRLAEAAVSRASVILGDLKLARGKGAPIHWLLNNAKAKAAEALQAMVDVDPTDVATLRRLQNDVKLYRLLVDFIRETIADAEDAHHALEAEDRDDLLSLVGNAAAAVAEAYAEG